jgi:hypothetical protein
VAEARLTAGTRAHHRIGQRTDDIQVVAQIRLVLLAAILVLIAWLALQVLGPSGSLT